MTTGRNRWLAGYSFLVYLFIFLPIFILILFSFNESSYEWEGFTTDWYGSLFANEQLLDALSVTLRLAVVSVLISVVLGSLLGLAMARIPYRGRATTETVILLTMVTPEIVLGLSLLIFFLTFFNANGSFEQLVVAHVTFCVGYIAITVRARAAGMNQQLEEAARDLGASAAGAFWHVTLPLIAPGVAAGAMLAFALSFDDYVVTTFNAGVGSSTLPLYIYGRIKFGVTPEINAISTIIVLTTAVLIFIAWRAGAFRGERPAATAA